MKEGLLRYALIAVIATLAVSGYGDGRVDYDKMCSLVTNQLISLRHNGMKMSCLSAIKTQTGANNFEIANCLSAYIRAKRGARPCTLDYEQCLSAIELFSRLANDKQYAVLADVAQDDTNATAAVSFGYYFRRMKKTDGLMLAERILDAKTLSPNMRVEILATLKNDVQDSSSADPAYKQALCQLSRRQIVKRRHCKVFDEMLYRLDPEYERSDLRRDLIRDASQGKIPGMIGQLPREIKEDR